jgi:hypothetical protein
MIVRKYATRQHNLPDVELVCAISKVPKLFEQTTYELFYPFNETFWTVVKSHVNRKYRNMLIEFCLCEAVINV